MSEGRTNDDIFKLLQILNENNKRIEDRLERIETGLCKEVNNIQERVQVLEAENRELKSKLLDLQRFKKKYNLVIYGVNEDEEDLKFKIDDIIKSKLDVPFDVSEIRDLYRLGKPKENNKPRPILIELTSYAKKLYFLKKTFKLKGSGIYINKDLTEHEQKERNILITHLKKARERHCNAKIQRNKLIINGETYGIEELLKNNDLISSVTEYQGVASPKPSTTSNKYENENSTDPVQDSPNSINKTENTGRNLRRNFYYNKAIDKKKPNTEERELKESKKRKN